MSSQDIAWQGELDRRSSAIETTTPNVASGRPAARRNQHVPAAQRRAIHSQRVAALRDMLAIAQPTVPETDLAAPTRPAWRES